MDPSETKIPAFLRASWIWLPGEPVPRNTIAEFRSSFNIRQLPKSAHLLISADSRYVLSINGRRLGYGPARNFPNHYEFDEHDAASHLRQGRNTVTVLVQHWGEGNIQSFVSRAGVIMEIQSRGHVLAATDASWQGRRSPAYEPVTPRIACMMPFEEQALGSNDGGAGTGWKSAVLIGSPGCPPWGKLTPRTIPLLTDDPWECVSAMDAGVAVDAPLVLSLRAGLLLVPEYRSMNSVEVDGVFATELHMPRAGQLWIKHGAMYSGPISMRLDGRPLGFEQDVFDLRATCKVAQGDHLLVLDWKGIAHDLDIGIAVGGIAGVTQLPFREHSGARWLYLPGRKGRSRARKAKSRSELEQNGPAWQAVPKAAIPERDIYMAVTCRDVVEARKSRELPCSLDPLEDSRAAHRILLDFGRHANGFIELDLEAGAGTVIEGAGVEGINLGSIQFTELNNNTFSYRCREGMQTFTSILPRGLRYLVLDVKPRERSARLVAARMRVSTYPWRPQGSFRCSDTRLNQIYELCTHTLRMCSMDTFVDATYEQALWVGDAASMITQVHHYVQGESSLPGRSFRLAAQSLERMPRVNSQVPSAWENRPIPNWSFLWSMGVRDHFLFSGDLAFAREMLPALERQAGFITGTLDPEGLFAMHGDVWHFLDWNGCENDHGHAATRTYASENALAIASLHATAEIARALGKSTLSEHWMRLAKKIATSMRRAFWNSTAKGFSETRADGKTSSTLTASTQICALMAGLFPPTIVQEASRKVLAPGSDWLPTGTPWMWSLGARQALEAGEAGPVLAGMRRFWGDMLDRGATTAWEMFEGHHRPGIPTRSWCHGWSAGPAWLLPAYILGVRPVEPGWKRVRIAPQPGDLQWAEGAVPTPHGPIRVRWERGANGRTHLSTDLPHGVSKTEQ